MGNLRTVFLLLAAACLLVPVWAGANDAVLDLGIEQMKAGKYEEAQRLFSAVIDLSPGNVDAYNYRAMARISLGLYGLAAEDSTAAIAIEPESYRAYTSRGYARARMGASSGAMADFQKAISINPRSPDARCYRANLWLEKGMYDLAIEDCSQAVQAAPNFAKAYNIRGYAWEKKGNYNQAINDYRHAIQADPGYARAMNNLAWVLATCPLAAHRNGAEAVELIDKAIRIDPQGSYLDTQAAAYAETGRYQEAAAIQKKAIQRSGNNLPPEKKVEYANRLALYQTNQAVNRRPTPVTVAAAPAPRPKVAPAPVSPPPAIAATAPVRRPAAFWTHPYAIQIASNQERETSYAKARSLQQVGRPAYITPAKIPGRGTWYRVLVGHYRNLSEAKSALQEIKRGVAPDAVVTKMPFAVRVGPSGPKQDRTTIEEWLKTRGYFPYSTAGPLPKGYAELLVGAFEKRQAAADLARKLQIGGFSAEPVRR